MIIKPVYNCSSLAQITKYFKALERKERLLVVQNAPGCGKSHAKCSGLADRLGCRQWKPWHAADELGKEKNNAELSAMPATLKQMLVSKKFIKRSNQYMIGAGEADQSIINLILLSAWINRIR